METLGLLLGFGLLPGVRHPWESLVAIGVVVLASLFRKKGVSFRMPVWVYGLLGLLSVVVLSLDLMAYIGRKSFWPVCGAWMVIWSVYGQKKERDYHLAGEESLQRMIRRLVYLGMAVLFWNQLGIADFLSITPHALKLKWVLVLGIWFGVLSMPFGMQLKNALCFGTSILLLRATLPLTVLRGNPAVFLELGRTGGTKFVTLPRLEILAAMLFWTTLFFALRGCMAKVREGIDR
ncbi:MAG: hypothetical protein E7277_01770 [Lachnospiraceae bacterium]|nr:hypothetical protein [Lachnospiraceae bacterium]